ncbi:DegT/DnrJ/EryC1/StrS family aminotransferase [Rhodococcus kroppenstedtii]|uniref:DegT/DnrJ/EryC1/StrS family aminotransferase n=1 Tax=Rhodococcoides kroppenstedtii TaxID=293050 RepID=UPI001C9A6241|nr:DegT/DnrJ/EryC1/StrS family aminotransferase [Rhodococcus kroppenstedtii]MBY6436603.1 DegT/DnrJ/EryC1/StrS family aminotransferase [Rhodococcus kroppenstedtii]
MTVPFVDLPAQQAEIHDEIVPVLEDLLRSAAFVGGPAVARFERDYAAFVGVDHCVGVGNGTDAVELALRGVGVGPGDEVILPANTFVATAEAVSRIGADPVLVDVDPASLLLDPDAAARAVTDRTAAIVPVHLYGQTAPMDEILAVADAHGLAVVEDAAQSQGATRNGRAAGSFGRAAATSFYPGKNLGAAGDAGAVLTSDPEVAQRIRVLAAHGSARRYEHEVIGLNSRLDALQAVVLSAKLARLEKWNRSRQDAAERYAELLGDVDGLELPSSRPGNDDVWHLHVVRTDRRDELAAALADAGIGTGIHYPTPIHLTQAYRGLGLGPGSFPVAERAAGRILSLPMYPHLTADRQERVAEVVRRVCAGTAGG